MKWCLIYLFAINTLMAEQEKEQKQKQEKPVVQSTVYTHPGLISLNQNQGSDHLYNLASRIYVSVEVQSLKEKVNDISTERLVELIGVRFRNVHIEPYVPAYSGDLPLFNVLVMINPINRGFAVDVQARLFESVTLSRFVLASGTAFQAITWESQSLIVTPTDDLAKEVTKSVDAMAKLFADRFAYFEDLRFRRTHEN